MMAPVYTPLAPISSSIDSAVRSEISSAPVSVNDDLSAAKRMVEMLRNSGNPKFANSTFVDFIDQVTTGDLRFEDGAVVDREGKPVDWDEVYGEDQEAVDGGLGDILASAGDDVENFPDQMERIWNELRNDNSFLQPEEYQFQHTSNKYIDAESPLEIAIRLLKEGRDADAMIALEAEVRQNPDSSEGWRLLGQLLAQFDRDVDAIKCLDKGHACDAFNLDSMMALGVSLTNELDSIRAMEILKSWIRSNEKYHQLVSIRGNESGVPDYDFIQIKKEVIDLFNQAAKIDPNDFDVAVALGVLHNINREYSLAITSLVNAVQLRPNDFTAWNKLGATMANSGLPRDSLLSYHQALALKPNYARAWSNLAIAHSNLDDYENAVRFFLAALQLSPGANHLWSSLVLALSNWKPTDESLSDMLEQKDLSALLNYVDGAPRIEQLPAPRQPAANTVSEILNQVMQTVNRT
jgi:peroxin-5